MKSTPVRKANRKRKKLKMRYDVIPLLKCPICRSSDLECLTFKEYSVQEIDEGVIWCGECKNWYPIQDGLLDFLTGSLAYVDDRRKFWMAHSDQMKKNGLNPGLSTDDDKKNLQAIQQHHFDWYANNSLQTYNEYEQQPFWRAADRLVFELWNKDVTPDSTLLDVCCAEGRGAFRFMDLDVTIVGFDVSKALVRQAIRRYRTGSFRAKATFFTADAGHFPFKDSSFDRVLVYGVLHHLPDPVSACKEIARVLKPNGKYFGSENNSSIFRPIFDVLQKLNPLWHEEAGPEALISKGSITEAFKDTDIKVRIHTSVFLPPHLVNLLTQKDADRLISITDNIGRAIPFLRDHGGLIVINGIKSKR